MPPAVRQDAPISVIFSLVLSLISGLSFLRGVHQLTSSFQTLGTAISNKFVRGLGTFPWANFANDAEVPQQFRVTFFVPKMKIMRGTEGKERAKANATSCAFVFKLYSVP